MISSSNETLLVKNLTTFLSCALTSSNNDNGELMEPWNASQKLQQLFCNSHSEDVGDAGDSADWCLRTPSLRLRQQEDDDLDYSPEITTTTNSSFKSVLQGKVAKLLSTPVQVAQHELKQVPVNLLRNLSDSFLGLVDARLRSSIAALVQSSSTRIMGNKNNNVPSSHSTLVDFLCSNYTQMTILPTAVITTFQTLSTPLHVEDNMYIAPIQMEAIFDMDVLGSQDTAKIECNGTIVILVSSPGTTTGSTSEEDYDDDVVPEELRGPSLLAAELKLDTASLLKSLMEQARVLVRKALTATTLMLSFSVSATANPSFFLSSSRDESHYAQKETHDNKSQRNNSNQVLPVPQQPQCDHLTIQNYNNNNAVDNTFQNLEPNAVSFPPNCWNTVPQQQQQHTGNYNSNEQQQPPLGNGNSNWESMVPFSSVRYEGTPPQQPVGAPIIGGSSSMMGRNNKQQEDDRQQQGLECCRNNTTGVDSCCAAVKAPITSNHPTTNNNNNNGGLDQLTQAILTIKRRMQVDASEPEKVKSRKLNTDDK